MADIAATTQRVLEISRAYRQLAGALLTRAQLLRNDGTITDFELASVREAGQQIIGRAQDMLVVLDDALAAQVDGALVVIERGTESLKKAEADIVRVTAIVDVAIKAVAAAAAVALLVATPTAAAAGAAAAAIGGAAATIGSAATERTG